MNLTIIRALVLTAACATVPALEAQEPQTQPPAAAEPEQAPQVSDEDMDTFATIYVELQETALKYEEEIAAVETEAQAQEVQARMQKESIGTLEKHGWTPDRFNRVADALNRSPELTEKALRLIEEKS